MFEILKDRWEKGTITLAMLQIYVKKGVITEAELEEITRADTSK